MTPGPDPRATQAHEVNAISMPGIDVTHPNLRKKLAAELRAAALHAREFAQPLKSPELKESFLQLAAKWEAEAQTLDDAP
jgi:hypothetical protein